MIRIKNVWELFAAVLFAASMSSCGGSLFDLAVQREEPFEDVVFTSVVAEQSGNVGAVLSVSWKSDEGADNYILMRSEEGKTGYGDFIEVYGGTKTEYLDKTLKRDTSYMYRLDKERGNKIFPGKKVTTYAHVLEKPFPGIITVESMNEGESVSLSWQADAWAELYILLKTEITDQGINFTNQDVTEEIEISGKTNHVDNEIETEKSYAYRLHKRRGEEIFEESEIAIFGRTRLDPFPDVVVAENVNNGTAVSLRWNYDPGADSYIVMRSSDEDPDEYDNFIKLYEGNDTAYLDKLIKKEFSYMYRLDKKLGEKIFFGKEIITFRKTRPDLFPGKIEAKSLRGGKAAYLTWEEDLGADEYRIMRSLNDDNEMRFVVREDGDDGFSMQGEASALDDNLEDDKSYVYRLDKKRGGIWHEGKDLAILPLTRPLPFQGKIEAKSLRGGKASYLTWEEDIGADEYRIMRSLNDDSEMQFVVREDGDDGFSMQGETSALDDNLEDDKSYVYRLDKRRGNTWYKGKDLTIFSLTRPLPYGEAPKADGFRTDGSIYLQWSYDEGADSNILMRRFDDPIDGFDNDGGDDWEKVYEGLEINFLDEDVDDIRSGRYEYRLDKKRNGIVYDWSDETVLVVAAHAEEDRHEPNNRYEESVELETYLEANLYYYRCSDGRELVGSDWYKVYVHPGKTAYIKVLYRNMADENWLQVAEADESPKAIRHNEDFGIKNDTAEKRYIFFEIQPNKMEFLQGLNVGGSILNYTIELVEIADI